MKLIIFNSDKQATEDEPAKESAMEEHKRQQDEAMRQVEKEHIMQEEQFKKRLAERKRITS